MSVRQGGKVHYAMVPAYTTDGGHLNEVGRRIVARRLLVLLAGLAAPRK
jgi:lysophospholipase L1-like esterase